MSMVLYIWELEWFIPMEETESKDINVYFFAKILEADGYSGT